MHKLAKITPRRTLGAIMVAMTIALAVIATVASVNYYQLYPALDQLQLKVSTFSWTPVNSFGGGIIIELQKIVFTIANPTGYRGLSLEHFGATLFIFDNYNNTFPQGSLPYATGSGPLDPGGTITITVPPFNSTAFTGNAASETSNLHYDVDVQLALASFLDKVGTITGSYLCDSAGGPISCQEIAVTISGTPGGTTGGAGDPAP